MLEAIFFLVLYIYPLHWAAEFAEAEESNYLKCLVLSVVTTIVKVAIMILLAGSPLIAFLLAAIVSIIICMKVLKIPSHNFFMFAIMLAFLSLVISGAATLVINGVLGR